MLITSKTLGIQDAINKNRVNNREVILVYFVIDICIMINP